MFIVAFHLASGQTPPPPLLRALGAAPASLRVAIGLGHRIFGVRRSSTGCLNPTNRRTADRALRQRNHTAELLELSAFVCLACRFSVDRAQPDRLAGRDARLRRRRRSRPCRVAPSSRWRWRRPGVRLPALLRPATASLGRRRRFARLGRGCFLSRRRARARRRFGAGQLVDRFRDRARRRRTFDFSSGATGCACFAAHPFGIGRGAFDRVFPVYRDREHALSAPVRLRRKRAAAAPDRSAAGSSSLLLAAGVCARRLARRPPRAARQDRSRAGRRSVRGPGPQPRRLRSGDAGRPLPFMAVLGSVLGRMQSARAGARLRRPRGPGDHSRRGLRRRLRDRRDGAPQLRRFRCSAEAGPTAPMRGAPSCVRAQQTHPLDYFYPLAYARLAPLKGAPGRTLAPSARPQSRAAALSVLRERARRDRAESVAARAAPTGAAGMADGGRPSARHCSRTSLGELFVAGANPRSSLPSRRPDIDRALELIAFLERAGARQRRVRRPRSGRALVAPAAKSCSRGHLQLKGGQLDAATATSTPRSSWVSRIRAWPLAVATVSRARARTAPTRRWRSSTRRPRAIRRRSACSGNASSSSRDTRGGTPPRARSRTQARPVSKLRIGDRRPHLGRAHRRPARPLESIAGSYRIALADRPTDVALWVEYARAAETAGRA